MTEDRRLHAKISEELIQRVDGHELNPRLFKNLPGGDKRDRPLKAAISALVAIVIRSSGHEPVFIKQHIINTPRITTQASDLNPSRCDRAQSDFQLFENVRQIPAQRIEDLDGTVLEAMDFLEHELVIIEPAEHDTTTLSTQI